MKPTIKVSIGGVAFHLEEDAYQLLKQYLDRLQTHYEKMDGGKEIIDDIELRIAELLRERISSTEQAISETMVNEVTAILGEPENFETEEKAPNNKNSDTWKQRSQKKLYRDKDNKVLGGVCSGIAAYFNIDVVLVRVLFVVLFVGFSAIKFLFFGITGGTIALIYILLWIITPPASTLQQRYEMRGEKPDLKNIQRKVEEELREAGRSLKKSAPAANEVIEIIVKILGIFIGVIVVVIAISVLLAFVVAFVTGYSVVNILCFNIIDYIDVGWHSGWFFGLLAALVLIPFIGMLYGGIKLLFSLKTKLRIGLILFLFWVAALFTFVGMGIYHTASLFHWRTVQEYVELPAINCDTLFVDLPQNYYTEGELEPVIDQINHWSFFNKKKESNCKKKKRCLKSKKREKERKEIDFSFSHSPLFFYKKSSKTAEKLLLLPIIERKHIIGEKNFGIEIQKDAAGNSFQSAYRHAKQLPFNYTLKDSLLIIEPLIYTKDEKWDGELLRLNFQVPEGKKVVFGKAFRENN
jgi:phage shock protein PspC (stress-responsive transcriptional regulator)